MTNQEAIAWIKSIKDKYIHGGDDDFDEKRKKSLDMAIKALEQQPCEDKQDCEHCIHTYGTLGCCDMVNNEWIYDCDFGREQYRKEHGKPCEDCISREMALKESHKICIDGDVFDVVQVETLFALPSVTPKARWIPVSERLPEDGQDVLICDIDGDIMIGYHVRGRLATHFSQQGSYEHIKNVKAWQPLPEPYRAESGE